MSGTSSIETKRNRKQHCTVKLINWVRQVMFFNVKILTFVCGNHLHFRCLACWVVEFNYKCPFNTGWQQYKWPFQVLFRCPRPLNRGVRLIKVSFKVNKGNKFGDFGYCPLKLGLISGYLCWDFKHEANSASNFLGDIVRSQGNIPSWDLRDWNLSFEDVHEVYISNCRQKLYTPI